MTMPHKTSEVLFNLETQYRNQLKSLQEQTVVLEAKLEAMKDYRREYHQTIIKNCGLTTEPIKALTTADLATLTNYPSLLNPIVRENRYPGF